MTGAEINPNERRDRLIVLATWLLWVYTAANGLGSEGPAVAAGRMGAMRVEISRTPSARPSLLDRARGLAPGLALCAAVTLAALGLQAAEEALVGTPYLEAIVLAILVGTAIRSAWSPGRRWTPGIAFAAKTLLEVAVMLLGASVSAAVVWALGLALLAGIAAIVAAAILVGYAIGRALGLPPKMAALIACGNAICGNSAIAAVAPVIRAGRDEVATSIAFTAVLGVLVVLTLPLLVPLLNLSATQYGVVAGLTVYAVPQVLAATIPAGAVSVQVGTIVKLVRVLMLGPVVVLASLLAPRLGGDTDGRTAMPPLRQLIPWFIVAFLALAALRTAGLVPDALVGPSREAARVLTVLAMAALGLGVDAAAVMRAGGRATFTVVASLVALLAASLALIRLIGLA